MNMISERATTCIFMNAIPQLNQRVAPMSDCLSVWSCRTFVRDQNESDRTAPTACYWCPGCLVLQQHKNKIWIPHKIMVNRTTCRQLSPNIWENWIIIMLINGYKENTLSMVTYKLFKFFFFFYKLMYTAFTNLCLLCVRNRTSGPLAWTVRTHTWWQELFPPPAMHL